MLLATLRLYYFFFGKISLSGDEQRCREENRGVGAGDDSHKERERKVFGRRGADEVQDEEREQDRK